jgi:hypothetical protein
MKARNEKRTTKTYKPMNATKSGELCGEPGSFQKFLQQKKEFLKKNEEKRKARIKAARAARAMTWAAAGLVLA